MFGNKNKKKLKKQGPNAPGGRPLTERDVFAVTRKKYEQAKKKHMKFLDDFNKKVQENKKLMNQLLTIGHIESLSEKGKKKKK